MAIITFYTARSHFFRLLVKFPLVIDVGAHCYNCHLAGDYLECATIQTAPNMEFKRFYNFWRRCNNISDTLRLLLFFSAFLFSITNIRFCLYLFWNKPSYIVAIGFSELVFSFKWFLLWQINFMLLFYHTHALGVLRSSGILQDRLCAISSANMHYCFGLIL